MKYNISKLTLSTDKIRREVQGQWFEHNPELIGGGVTYGWLLEAYKSCEVVQNPDFQKNIKTPVFIGIAEDEVIVNNKDILTTAAGLKGAIVKEYENARHELLMERNEIRGQFLRDFKNFAFKIK
jgi:lysophospholipase